jgi:hypothetical protein
MELCFYRDSEGEFPLTFQVVLSASNGWIMASDTKETHHNRIREPDSILDTTFTSKLFLDEETKTVYMMAADSLLARSVTANVLRSLRRYDKYPPDKWIEKNVPAIANAAWRKIEDAEVFADIIFVFGSCEPFWALRVYKNSHIQRVYFHGYGGGVTNSAKFFVEQYHDHERTVRELLPLAAHTILMAAERSSGVGGLEMFFFEVGTGVTQWRDGHPELQSLKERSRCLDAEIRRRILFNAN